MIIVTNRDRCFSGACIYAPCSTAAWQPLTKGVYLMLSDGKGWPHCTIALDEDLNGLVLICVCLRTRGRCTLCDKPPLNQAWRLRLPCWVPHTVVTTNCERGHNAGAHRLRVSSPSVRQSWTLSRSHRTLSLLCAKSVSKQQKYINRISKTPKSVAARLFLTDIPRDMADQ